MTTFRERNGNSSARTNAATLGGVDRNRAHQHRVGGRYDGLFAIAIMLCPGACSLSFEVGPFDGGTDGGQGTNDGHAADGGHAADASGGTDGGKPDTGPPVTPCANANFFCDGFERTGNVLGSWKAFDPPSGESFAIATPGYTSPRALRMLLPAPAGSRARLVHSSRRASRIHLEVAVKFDPNVRRKIHPVVLDFSEPGATAERAVILLVDQGELRVGAGAPIGDVVPLPESSTATWQLVQIDVDKGTGNVVTARVGNASTVTVASNVSLLPGTFELIVGADHADDNPESQVQITFDDVKLQIWP